MNLKKLSIIILLVAILSLLSIAPVNAVVYNVAFDSSLYVDTYSDLQAAYGFDPEGAYNHFVVSGLNEQRVASPVFDVAYYLNNYEDLRNVLGSDNYVGAYYHFLNNGMAEGRTASAQFNPVLYVSNYTDLQDVIGNNYAAAYSHYLTNGIAEGRVANTSVPGATVPEDHTHEMVLTKVLIAATCIDDGEGVYSCACGNVEDEVRTIPASADYHDYVHKATEGSYKIYVCSVCNDTKVELIEGTAHVHDYAIVDEIDSTCTKVGTITKVCQNEGCPQSEKVVTETIPMKDHEADDSAPYVITAAVKCTVNGVGSDGLERVVCKNCKKSFTRTISAHNYNSGVVTLAATCTETGTKLFTCKDCGTTNTEEIEAKGHDFGDIIPLVLPTCEKTGLSEKVCGVCGIEEKTVVKANGHSFENEENPTVVTAWLNEDGDEITPATGKAYTCYYTQANKYTCTNTNCDSKIRVPSSTSHYVYETVKTVTGHLVDNSATVTEGYATLKLTSIGNNIYEVKENDKYVRDASGKIVVTTTGTVDCSHEKVKIFTCKTCGEPEIVVPTKSATKHPGTVEEYPVTCTTQEYTLTSCTVCNKVIKEVDETVDLLKHEYEFVAATCTEAAYVKCTVGGERHYNSSPAGFVLEAGQVLPTPALGHKIVANNADNSEGFCVNEGTWVKGAAICANEKTTTKASTTFPGIDNELKTRLEAVTVTVKNNVVTVKQIKDFGDMTDNQEKNAVGIMLDVGIKAEHLKITSKGYEFNPNGSDTNFEQMKKWNANATENSFMIWLLPSEMGDGFSITFEDETGYVTVPVTVTFVFDAGEFAAE